MQFIGCASNVAVGRLSAETPCRGGGQCDTRVTRSVSENAA